MGKQKMRVPPLWNSEQSYSVLKWCDSDCVAGKAEEECLHPEHLHTGVGTFRGAKAKPESVMCYNTEYSMDVPDQMQGRTPSEAVRKMASGGLL